jgi:hypothetical protein
MVALVVGLCCAGFINQNGVIDLSSERALHRDNTATFRRKIISGHKFQSELDTKTY